MFAKDCLGDYPRSDFKMIPQGKLVRKDVQYYECKNSNEIWKHFLMSDTDYRKCKICDRECKATGGNTSNLWKHLKEHKIKQTSK